MSSLLADRNASLPLDPLTGFGSRERLLADLEQALVPGSPLRLLVVFELVGLRGMLAVGSPVQAEALIARLANRLGDELGDSAICYRPRAEEFCAILPLEEAERMLVAATAALSDAAKPVLLTPCCGAVLLPAEVAEPLEALELADQRLYFTSRAHERRRRRDH